MTNKNRVSIVLLVSCCIYAVASQTPAEKALLAVEALNEWYSPANGQWSTTGWWNSANALTAVIQYSALTNTHTYDNMTSNTYSLNMYNDFLNNYYDDEGWWALAWVEAYKFNGNKKFIKMAAKIFDDIAASWDDHCGGGVWWDRGESYKNAIPNELTLQLASALYIHTGKQQYLDFSNKLWNWFSNSGMINEQHLVNDGLTSDCKNNNRTTWTYNQGVILGGLVNMYTITNDTIFLDEASAIADAVINTLVTAEGILFEPCPTKCDGDQSQFKGIFIRNLGYLYVATNNANYASFIQRNADSIWNNARSGYTFGMMWEGPFDVTDASRQSSAVDALNAVLLLNREN